MRTVSIEGKTCHIIGEPACGRIVYFGTHSGAADDVRALAKRMTAAAPKAEFSLVAFEEPDWNGAFSPWPSPAVNAGGDFAGNGDATLEWLLDACIPAVEDALVEEPQRFIAGYSLAGLFALWALGQTSVFAGVVSASGSMWFPGFAEYAAAMPLPEDSAVYLSYGAKEEKARNRAMASVGDATRRLASQLAQDPRVLRTTLVENPGGHFTDPTGRIASGLTWLLNC